MHLEYAKRPPRGVTQLMYVGDDEIAAAGGSAKPVWIAAALGGGVLAVMAQSKGTRQLGAAGAVLAGLIALIVR